MLPGGGDRRSRSISISWSATAGDWCAACDVLVGLFQASFKSECGHTFHLRCVSGAAACPSCKAPWRDAPPALTPAPVPASPFSFGVSSSTQPACCPRDDKRLQQPPAPTPKPLSFLQPPASTVPVFVPVANPFFPVMAWCAVCRGAVQRGQATVKSECNHTFHLRCFSGSACPSCNARWRDHVAATTRTRPSFFFPAVQPQCPFGPARGSRETQVFDDDEPMMEPPAPFDGRNAAVQEAANGGEVLMLNTHCEYSAITRGMPHENFAVLVHAKAPGGSASAPRAPLDLVTVLDVSWSMQGAKLALLKAAMGFVIDKLGPADRLSIVSFSDDAHRVIRLMRMSDEGKASAKCAVQLLAAGGGTNIFKGLGESAKVLDGRQHRNTVASVILLSDGQNTYDQRWSGFSYSGAKNFSDLVPRSLASSDGNKSTPIHTFGFGTDHDAAAMHTIAEVTGGTFSFVENEAVVQDSFAQCIGGLLSVAVQEASILVTCPHPGVRVRAVKSGGYKSRVFAYGRAASVDIGELYAEEERRFLLFVDVPRANAEDEDITRLIKVSCTYRDSVTGRSMDVAAGEDAVVRRPVEVTGQEKPSVEVVLERFRMEATQDIATARAAAERGDHAEATRILNNRQEASQRLAGDARCAALVSELRELSARVASRREYENTGRACLFASGISHAQQRTASVNVFGAMANVGSAAPGFASTTSPFCATGSPPFGATAGPAFGAAASYATPQMKAMVESSRKARGLPPPTTMPNSSIFAKPRATAPNPFSFAVSSSKQPEPAAAATIATPKGFFFAPNYGSS